MEKNKKDKSKSMDAFSRIDYRRMISWSKRIQRESPFLTEYLNQIPTKSLLDLGCGTGEHSRFFADSGFKVVGIDRSESMLSRANDSPVPDNLEFLHSDILHLSQTVSGQFGAVIALGNTLVSITQQNEIQDAFDQIAERLITGGIFIFQILNYSRIRNQKIRNLPLNFVEEKGGHETIFLRIMRHQDNGLVDFFPTTLTLDPTLDPPIQVSQSSHIQLRGWILKELSCFLENSGFEISAYFGDMQKCPYDASNSNDLVVVARKE